MCRFRVYEQIVADTSSDRRNNLINALRSYQRDGSLSRLEAARSALSDLKAQLSQAQPSDLKAEVERTIEQLETTSQDFFNQVN